MPEKDKQPKVVRGTTCEVRMDRENGFVLKNPQTLPIDELANRLAALRQLFLDFLKPEIDEDDAEILVPKCVIAQNGTRHLKQRLVEGQSLCDLSDAEIDSLPESTKVDIIKLLTHYLITIKCCPQFTPDIFGFDDKFTGLERILKTLNPRFSTNMRVTKDGELSIIDLDSYFRSERPFHRKLAAKVLTPVMVHYTESFRARLLKTVNLPGLSLSDDFFLSSLKYGSCDHVTKGINIKRPEELVKFQQFIRIDGAVKKIGHSLRELKMLTNSFKILYKELSKNAATGQDKDASAQADEFFKEFNQHAKYLVMSIRTAFEEITKMRGSDEEWGKRKTEFTSSYPALVPALKRFEQSLGLLISVSKSRMFAEPLLESAQLLGQLIAFSAEKFLTTEAWEAARQRFSKKPSIVGNADANL